MEETSGMDHPFYLNDAETVTTDHLKLSDMRSLGDNVKLLAVIENLGCDLVSKSENAYKKIDEIDRESEVKSVAVKNLINEFQMLADSQFIENRIYDEDTVDLHREISEDPIADISENNKITPDQKILPIIHECISSSLQFIDDKFDLPSSHIRQANESDEEEDYVKEALAKAYESNPFNKTPLPSIIGSQEFFNQSLFNDGGNQAPETNLEYCSEPSDKFSDDNDQVESEDSDEEEQNLFTTINDSIRNYPLNTSNMKAEDKLNGKDEVSYHKNTQLSTDQKAEMERKAMQKKPVSLIDEFSDDDDEDDDLFTASSSKISTPIAKLNDSVVKSTKEEKVNEESKVMKAAINIPSPSISEKIKPTPNSRARSESDDSSDDSLFSDFKSKLSKILTSEPISNKRDSQRVSKEVRSSSTSSTSSTDSTKKIPVVQGKNNMSKKNLFDETSNDERDDLFEVKNKPIVSKITKGISDDDDDDDDLFKTSSTKIQTPISKVNNGAKTSIAKLNDSAVKSTNDERADEGSKIMKVAINIPSFKNQEEIKSALSSTSRLEAKPISDDDDDDDEDDDLFKTFSTKISTPIVKLNDSVVKSTKEEKVNEESKVMKAAINIPTSSVSEEIKRKPNLRARSESDDSSDNSLFSDFKSKLSKILTNGPKSNKRDSQRVSKEVRSPSTSSNSSKDNAETIPEIQDQHNVSEKNLFSEISNDERDDILVVKNKPYASNLPAEIPDDEDDDDDDENDLFRTSFAKMRTPIASAKNVSKTTKEEKVSKESKIAINTASSNASEKIKSIRNTTLRPESDDDSSDDSLFSDFKFKSSKTSTNKPISDKPVSKSVPKELPTPSNSSTSNKDNGEKISIVQSQTSVSEKNLHGETSNPEKDNLFKIKSVSTAPNEAKLISDDDDDDDEDDDLFKTFSTKIATPIVKLNDSVVKSTKEEKVNEESKVMKAAINIPSPSVFEKIKPRPNLRARSESDDSSDDSLFSDFKSKSSKLLTDKPISGQSVSKREPTELRSSPTSSTSSQDNAEKISVIQSQNNVSDKNLFDETSDDEKDDLFGVENKPIVPNVARIFSDSDDDDLFKTSSTKIQTPISKVNNGAKTSIAKLNDSAVKSTNDERADEGSKIMKVAINIPSFKNQEEIKSALSSTSRLESDDSSDDSLFSNFKSKKSSTLVETKKNANDAKKSPFIQVAQSPTLSTVRKEDLYKNIFAGTSDDDQDDLFAVKNESKPPPVKPRYNLLKKNSQQKEKTDH